MKSKIEWTDSTWSPVTGCTPISTGCQNCYAKREVESRWSKNPKSVFFGREFSDVQCHESELSRPLHWKKPRKIFVCPRADLFHPDVPFEFIDHVFAVVALAPQHTFQVLTKRADRMHEYLTSKNRHDPIIDAMNAMFNIRAAALKWPLPNIWFGITAENQQAADSRIHLLLQCPAAVHFVSVEPMVGAVDIRRHLLSTYDKAAHDFQMLPGLDRTDKLDWVICGGESGSRARPMHPDWPRSLRDQCDEAGVPFMLKQWGKWKPYVNESHYTHCGDEKQPHAWVDSETGDSGLCWIVDDDGSWSNHTGNPRCDAEGNAASTVAVMGNWAREADRLLDLVLHDEYPKGE
ncbi:MAG: phage hypothetical protein [Burkholderiaceae bacterium]|nr:phage hypothetical protein [Burkholderiaceae bacterium]